MTNEFLDRLRSVGGREVGESTLACRPPEFIDTECDECGHLVSLHDVKEGCTFERGDSYESGYAPMALGPCSCTAVTFEIEEEGDNGESREYLSGPDLLGRNL